MSCSDRDLERRKAELTHALSYPTRLRILEVFAHGRGRPLSVEALTGALTKTPGFEHITAAKVHYHRALLADAGLIPKG